MTTESLADSIVKMTRQLRTTKDMHSKVASMLNVPEKEVSCSPFSLRASVLAVNSGVVFAHHELRKAITPMDDYERLKRKELAEKMASRAPQLTKKQITAMSKSGGGSGGEAKKIGMSSSTEQELLARVEQDETRCAELMAIAPRWTLGELEMPKYESFAQDDMHATYNPGHIAKWTAHELIHRWCRFYWREGMTKWEMYLGAKLNELLPVVHWHALDEVMRNPQWLVDDQDATQAASFLKSALTFFDKELDLLESEIFKGLNSLANKPIAEDTSIMHGGHHQALPDSVLEWSELDSVTDTIMYVRAHHPRVASDPFVTAIGSLREGKDYVSTIKEYRVLIEARLDQLLFGVVQLDEKSAATQREHRTKADLVMREANRQYQVYYNYAMSSEKSAESDLRRLAHLGRTLQKKTTSDFLAEAGNYLSPAMLATGLAGSDANLSFTQLHEGMDSCIPATTSLLDYCLEHELITFPESTGITSLETLIAAFGRSSALLERAPLPTRFMTFLRQVKPLIPEVFGQLVAFEEVIIARSKQPDYWVEELSVDVDEDLDEKDLDTFTLIASKSYEMIRSRHCFLSQLHKTFSKDISAEVQEMEVSINNKKILERELAKYHGEIRGLVEQSFDSAQYDVETIYLAGLFDGQFYALDMLPYWADIWSMLISHQNGVSFKDFKSSARSLLERLHPTVKFDRKLFNNTVLQLNQYGALGMFPQVE
eukprot:gene15955-18969_t